MSLARGLHVQGAVIQALIIRETRTRFGQHQLGYLWALVEPALMIATFAGMYHLAERTAPGGMDVLPFLTTGFVTFGLFRGACGQCTNAVNGNKGLLFYPPVQPIDLIAARAGLEIATHICVFVVFVLGLGLFEQGFSTIDDLLLLVGGFLLAGALGTALGLCFCSLAQFSPTVDRIVGPLLRPLFWISGLFYSIGDLPSSVRAFMLYNPVLHAVDMVRDGWFVAYDSPYHSFWYLAAWITALAFVGLALERAARRRIEVT